MRRDLMDILACPVCKGELTLAVTSEAADGEVLEGSLSCAACDEQYPISDGIPNLLPPDLRREMEAEAAGTGGGSA
ncbi:MAG: methytransferase partner Trm112 [Dehalococcoidia bacterium]